MSLFHNDSAAATDPVGVGLDRARLRHVHPRDLVARVIDRLSNFEAVLNEHLQIGDSRAALLLSTSPLRVAAYSDEFDCAVVLAYDQTAGERIASGTKDLRAGMRLLSVNTYTRAQRLAGDLCHGPASCERYSNFYPVIADFYSLDTVAIELRKAAIEESEWTRCKVAAAEYLNRTNGACRNGSPWESIRASSRA